MATRTPLEALRAYRFQRGLSLQPSLEVEPRHDSCDAATGAGMEIGGCLIVSDALTGLSADGRVRRLLVQPDQGFRDSRVSILFSFDPTPSTPLGFIVKVAPSWGGQATSGAQALSGQETVAGMPRSQVRRISDTIQYASHVINVMLPNFGNFRLKGKCLTAVDAAAIYGPKAEAIEGRCPLMSGGVVLEEGVIPLEANGQMSGFIDEAFPLTGTSDFDGSLPCAAPGEGLFTALAADAINRIFTTLPVCTGGRKDVAGIDGGARCCRCASQHRTGSGALRGKYPPPGWPSRVWIRSARCGAISQRVRILGAIIGGRYPRGPTR